MKRRHFIGSTAAVAAAGTVGIQQGAGPNARLRVTGARVELHLKELSEFGKNPQGGVSRVAYSEFDKQGRAYVMGLMKAAKLDVSVDTAGNIWGRRAGRVAGLKPIVFGSHIDSVPEGGNYDGDVGVLGSIEVAQTFAENNLTTRHPLEVVVWQNEEGGLYGSHAATGPVTAQELAATSVSGKTIRDGITFLGGDPTKLDASRKAAGSVHGYFELHIEQGGILEQEKIEIGIVEGIVSIVRWDVTVEGFQNHAGTTAMNNRKDAMLAAARFIDMANRMVTSIPGRQVGTVGRIQAFPGAVNVIPGRVECSLELRDLDEPKIRKLGADIQAEAKKLGAMNGTTFTFKPSSTDHAATLSDPKWRGYVASASKLMGLSTKVMPSGAGHDAQNMARIGPMAMIFIPSVGGISHSPKEYSTPKDIENGVNVLMHAVLAADAEG
jgi:N-carbamoyl-L-amino-acid hydrolase